MSRTVYLHVGIAKTGTTHLQRTLYTNRVLLERLGTRYPGPGPAAHFFGSLDLRGATFQGHSYDQVTGAWQRLVSQADDFAGDTLISHETLAHASPDDIARAVRSFATDDVRVLITCRDLARQLPAVWQEMVKNRSTTPYDAFLTRVIADWSAPGGPRSAFWRAQHVTGLVGRWADQVGVDRVHVVTVPPRGADRGELWTRFTRAAELPAAAYAFPQDDGNTSMGTAEAEMLRRLNPLLDGALDWPTYDVLVKKGLAAKVLAGSGLHGRLGLPSVWSATVSEIAESTVASLEGSGVHVVGDLDDLLPAMPDVSDVSDVGGREPAELSDAEVLDVALHVVSTLVVEPRATALAAEPLVRRAVERLRGRLRRR